jgi:hypothetical protein
MGIEVITSFNETYWQTIGRDCVTSWIRHWPEPLRLTCYVEGFQMPDMPRCDVRDWSVLGHRYEAFQHSDQGHRVKIFAKKAYCIQHAWRNSDAKRLIWLDADVLTHANISRHFLESLCPDDQLITYMGVNHNSQGRWYHSAESGFFVVNLQHPDFDAFAARYEQRYNQHEHGDLRRFYDGEVLGAVCEEFRPRGSVMDICAKLGKDYKTPMRHTVLGQYLHHHKSKHSKEHWAQARQ